MSQNEKLVEIFMATGKISLDEARYFSAAFEYREIPANTLLLKEGQISNEYYVLNEGIIRAYAIDINGNDITTWFFTKGMPVFEPNSFFNQLPTSEYLATSVNTKLWSINFSKLNEYFHAHQAFREMGRYLLVKSFSALKQHTLNHITTSAENRYQQLLRNQPEIIQSVALKHVASFIGITDTSLSRIRANPIKK